MGTGVGLIAGANQFQFKEKYDALKEAEQKQKLSQPTKKLEKNEAKQKDLSELKTLLGTFKGDINSIINGDAFGKSKVEATGESASITTSSGVSVSDFDIKVEQLATKDAYQTASFSSEAYGIFNDVSIINSQGERQMLKSASFGLSIGKEEFIININSGDSLQSINDKILNATNANGKNLKDLVNTKVLDTGHDNYRLMLTSKEAGTDNEIFFSVQGNDEDSKDFSQAVLKKLGLLKAANASDLKKEMKEAESDLKTAKTILNGSEFDIKDLEKTISSLTAEKELEYTDKDGKKHSFKINKDTKLTELSADENKVVYDFYKAEQLNTWVKDELSSKGEIKITYKEEGKEKSFSIKDIKDLDKLSDTEKNALKIEQNKTEILGWVNHIKNSGEEITIKGTPEVVINKKTDFNSLSVEEQNIIRNYLDDNQKYYFSSQMTYDGAKAKYDKIDLSDSHVQPAQDAIFEYEGIKITRNSNTIDDLILGAKITLKKEGTTNFKVSDDIDSLLEHFDTFTTNYNAIINSLALSTKFDKETKESGSLQGVNEITKLKTDLSSLITKADAKNISLSSLGFEINDKGILSFKKTDFKKAFEKNPEDVKNFLQGSVKYEELTQSGSPVSEFIGLAEGDFKINGKDIVFDKEFIDKLNNKDSKVTKGEYLNKLVESINNAKIKGVSAKLGKEDNIIIVSDGKNPLEITGASDKLSKIGFQEKTQSVIKKEQIGIFRDFNDTLEGLISKKGRLTNLEESLKKEKKDLSDEIKDINQEIEKKFEMLANKLSSYDRILSRYDRQTQTINALIQAAFAK